MVSSHRPAGHEYNQRKGGSVPRSDAIEKYLSQKKNFHRANMKNEYGS